MSPIVENRSIDVRKESIFNGYPMVYTDLITNTQSTKDHLILFYRSAFLLLLLLLTFFRTILSLCLKSEIMDGFWSSRCLNDRIDLPDKIG